MKKSTFKKSILMLAFLVFGALGLHAQTVSGQLTDENGEPLIGASVFVDGTGQGAITDGEGRFILDADEGDTIIISYIGYETQRIVVGEDTNLSITMALDSAQLDEVIVVGYGEAIKKSHLTGSVSKVENEQLDQIAVTRVDEALIGQVSGANIAATEGEAGSAPTINIRGVGSVNASSGPAIIVDGIVVDSDYLTNLNMNDIESFEILKDAASAAIYGSEGSNGVIQIVTKSGQDGRTKFSYNGYFGTKSAIESEDYKKSVADWVDFELAQTGEISERTQYMQLLVETLGVDRDWQEVIFDGGLINNQYISARGGTKKTKYSTSFGYSSDEGVILTDDFTRYTAKLKLDTELSDRLKLGINLTPSFTDRRRTPSSVHNPLRQSPWLPIYHTEESLQFIDRDSYPDVGVGDYFFEDHLIELDLDGDGSDNRPRTSGDANPFAQFNERRRFEDRTQIVGAVKLRYKLADGLTVGTQFSTQYESRQRDQYDGVLHHSAGATRANYSLDDRVRTRLLSDNTITWVKTFNDHSLNTVVGGTYSDIGINQESVSASGFTNDLLPNLNGASPDQIVNTENFVEWNKLSYYGRVNYAFADKYLATVSVRRDGSSRFGPDNKWATFPAVSVGWNVAREDFLLNSDVVDNLKFRFSWGLTGNERFSTGDGLVVDYYPYLALLNNSNSVTNGSLVQGFSPANIANSVLAWEASSEFNPGLDFGIVNNKIQGSVDWYTRTSEDLLLDNPVSYVTGFNGGIVNLGEVVNSGFEFELRTRNVTKEKFQWSTTAIATMNENELTSFGDADGRLIEDTFGRNSLWINQVGQPLSSFYGFVVDEQLTNEYWATPFFPINSVSEDIIVKDLNGDGIITDADRTILGDPYPDLVWSLTNQFGLGPVDLSFMLQGSHGAEVRDVGEQYFGTHWQGATNNPSEVVADGLISDSSFLQERVLTSDIIENAGFMSLRNVNVGLDFGKLGGGLVNSLKLSNARFYVTGQNLIFIDDEGYQGFNPEFVESSARNITAWGSQRGGSPIQRTIAMGLNLDF